MDDQQSPPRRAAQPVPDPAEDPPGRFGILRLVDAVRCPEGMHSPRRSRQFSGFVLGYMLVAYWIVQELLPEWTSAHPDYNFYLIQPLLWGGLGVLSYYGWRRVDGRPAVSRILILIALVVGVFHVAVLVIAGLLLAFGESPLPQRLVDYPRNGLFIITLLAGLETARAYLFTVWRRLHERAAFVVITLLFAQLAVSLSLYDVTFDETELFLRIVGGRFVPAVALSAMATWLVQYGGLGPSFGYRFALVGFEWFSPEVPDLDWPVAAVLAAAIPLASVALIRNIYEDTEEFERLRPSEDGREEPAGEEEGGGRRWPVWAATAVGLLLLVLFVTGAFGVKPQLVSGISMEPAYERGDVTVIRDDVSPESLQIGDVIKYRRGSLAVVHRIVAIDGQPDGMVFTTQGDNVDRPDPPITADQVEGKVVFLIPKIGVISLWIRDAL